MTVKIISPTIQEYNGERYYLCGNYFQRKGKRLHVQVWKDRNGEVPKGFHVHHKDGNRLNNEIENLELVMGRIHISRHASSPERDEYNQKHIKDMRELASEWHRSEEGRAWHSKHMLETYQNWENKQYECSFCGKTFETRHHYGEGQHTFCSNACKTRWRSASGVDNETRKCLQCGNEFVCNKYAKKECCSKRCAVTRRWSQSK